MSSPYPGPTPSSPPGCYNTPKPVSRPHSLPSPAVPWVGTDGPTHQKGSLAEREGSKAWGCPLLSSLPKGEVTTLTLWKGGRLVVM